MCTVCKSSGFQGQKSVDSWNWSYRVMRHHMGARQPPPSCRHDILSPGLDDRTWRRTRVSNVQLASVHICDSL